MVDIDILVFTFFLYTVFAVIAVVDTRIGIIPNVTVFILGIFSIFGTYIFEYQSWWMMFLGAIIGGGMLLGLRIFYKQLRGIDGLGLGDVKLMIVGGGLLGPLYVGYAIAIGAVASLLWLFLFNKIALKSGQTKIPFGPGLCFGISVFWLCHVKGVHYGA